MRTGYRRTRGHPRGRARGKRRTVLSGKDVSDETSFTRTWKPGFSKLSVSPRWIRKAERSRAGPGSGGGDPFFERRVRSWLRMNAGGAPNTCKSSGTPPRWEASGERLSNTWTTCPLHRDNPAKAGLIPDGPRERHLPRGKAQAGGDGSAAHQADGGVTAHRACDG